MNKINLKAQNLNDYPLKTYDKIRYCDTDRQGHVNNAVFSVFLETGRAELVYDPKNSLTGPGDSFVLVSSKIDLLSELQWPGRVDIGTAVAHIGGSSVYLVQALFQNGKIAATAETVIVQTDETTKRSKPLTEKTKDILSRYMIASDAVSL